MGYSWFPNYNFFQNQYTLYVIRAIWLHFQGKLIILEKNAVSSYVYQRIVSLTSLMSFSDFSLTIPQWEDDQTKAAWWVVALWRLPVRRIWILLTIPTAFCFLKLFDYHSTHDHAGGKSHAGRPEWLRTWEMQHLWLVTGEYCGALGPVGSAAR